MQWRVLAIDDDADQLNAIERVFEAGIGEETFTVTKVTSFDDGKKAILADRYDLLILDVHEEGTDPDPATEPDKEDQRGEELLKELMALRFIPVVFYTGYPAKVRHLSSLVVKVVEKGSPIEEFREAISSIFSTKLPSLLKYIENQSRSYIWESLKDILAKPELDIDPPDISLLVARRLAQKLSQNDIKTIIGMDVGKINPIEMYQYPPDSTTCHPADIFLEKKTGEHWMVLTPACDFEQSKVENVLLAKVVLLIDHNLYVTWKAKEADFVAIDPKNVKEKKAAENIFKKARGDVKSLIKNKISDRYKYLPGTFFLADSVVDFQNLRTRPQICSDDFEVVCSLDNPYREELLNLFSRYYGRIGTPDYDFVPVWEKVENIASASTGK